MPFIPHTEDDVKQMLSVIGVPSIDALFAEIPEDLCQGDFSSLPTGLNEMELTRLMQARSKQSAQGLCFIGAGAYEHHIPAAVWEVATRGEFMTAYTPYQAEASQGSLQLMYEFQTMIASLTGLPVSNASLYDGASALAEAILMALRLLPVKREAKKVPSVLMPQTVHPHYREVVQAIVLQHPVELIEVPYELSTGRLSLATLEKLGERADIVVLPQPNFFGVLEEVDLITDWATANNKLVLGLVNPLALALLKPPGQWGKKGADLACGEGQPLGLPLSNGGPYYGFLCCKQEYIRQLPGRLVGRTLDQSGKEGFVLTLQAREQHIRRAKATSNICTNQGLMVIASTIYMSILGPQGLRRVALSAHQGAFALQQKLTSLPGIELLFTSPSFHEFALRLKRPVDLVLKALAERQIQGGYNLKWAYPELGEALLVCVTETKTAEDLEWYYKALQEVLA